MSISARDKRALMILGGAVVVIVIFFIASSDRQPAAVVAPVDSAAQADKQLVVMRQKSSQVPGRTEALEEAKKELSARETGLIRTETTAQAQAQIVQVLRRLAGAQAPPIEPKGFENGVVKPLGDDYGEVLVTMNFDARIEQIVNLLAELTAQSELIATHEIRLGAAGGKEKLVPVRLTVSGVVARALVPVRKGMSTL